MGLAHAGVTAEIELFEAALPLTSQCECGLARERIAWPDHEALEAEGQLRLPVVGVESGFEWASG